MTASTLKPGQKLRHKWIDNKCSICGIKRKRKHWKRLMAIVNHPPWEAYQHGCDMAYSSDDFNHWTFNRPNCNTPM